LFFCTFAQKFRHCPLSKIVFSLLGRKINSIDFMILLCFLISFHLAS
jgi:hypothetical protein